MKPIFVFAFGCLTTIAISGCTTPTQQTSSNTSNAGQANHTDNLTLLQGKAWIATKIGAETLPNTANTRPATIEFNATEPRFSGSDSCNRIMGSYTADQQTIQLSQIASTKMACLNQTGIDRKYHQALQHVTQYQVSSQQLILQNAQGQAVLTFTSPIQPR